jgi:hypothetical protein
MRDDTCIQTNKHTAVAPSCRHTNLRTRSSSVGSLTYSVKRRMALTFCWHSGRHGASLTAPLCGSDAFTMSPTIPFFACVCVRMYVAHALVPDIHTACKHSCILTASLNKHSYMHTHSIPQQEALIVLIDVGKSPAHQLRGNRSQHALHHRKMHVVVSKVKHCKARISSQS